MKLFRYFLLLTLFSAFSYTDGFAQKVAFMNSEAIRENFAEAKSAEQRIQSIVEQWKREIDEMKQTIENLEIEIQKNRLIWSDIEKLEKEELLVQKKNERMLFAKAKFEAGGEYDQTVKEIMKPIEEKIYAAVQEVAADYNVDLIWDQSIHPLPYVNFKYDLTVKILRKLGVDVSKMEEELKEKIRKDPNNKKSDSKKPKKRSRARRIKRDVEEEKQEEVKPEEKEEENKEEEVKKETETESK